MGFPVFFKRYTVECVCVCDGSWTIIQCVTHVLVLTIELMKALVIRCTHCSLFTVPCASWWVQWMANRRWSICNFRLLRINSNVHCFRLFDDFISVNTLYWRLETHFGALFQWPLSSSPNVCIVFGHCRYRTFRFKYPNGLQSIWFHFLCVHSIAYKLPPSKMPPL